MNANATKSYLDGMKSIGRAGPKMIRTLCASCGLSFLRREKGAHRCPRCLGDDLRGADS
jgi:uncharacterized Zn finger protein (UPF0148 family)